MIKTLACGNQFEDCKEYCNIKKNETVVFSYILYKSKKHRDSVNKKVMKEMT
ncbi:hypothetical protein CL654_03440 [bacterium]|nr:hypothetical protein [bacterium]